MVNFSDSAGSQKKKKKENEKQKINFDQCCVSLIHNNHKWVTEETEHIFSSIESSEEVETDSVYAAQSVPQELSLSRQPHCPIGIHHAETDSPK